MSNLFSLIFAIRVSAQSLRQRRDGILSYPCMKATKATQMTDKSTFPSYKTTDEVLGYLLREGDSGSVGVGASDQALGEFSATSPSERFTTEDGSGGGGALSHLLVGKPDQVWQPRSNNHAGLNQKTF